MLVKSFAAGDLAGAERGESLLGVNTANRFPSVARSGLQDNTVHSGIGAEGQSIQVSSFGEAPVGRLQIGYGEKTLAESEVKFGVAGSQLGGRQEVGDGLDMQALGGVRDAPLVH